MGCVLLYSSGNLLSGYIIIDDADIFVAELRIHEEIERGDNDSIKVGGKSVKVDKPCSAQ